MEVVGCSSSALGYEMLGIQHTEGTTASREVRESDLERNTNAIGISSCGDGAFDVATRIIGVEELLLRKSRDVDRSREVVLDNSSIAKNTSDWISRGLGTGASD